MLFTTRRTLSWAFACALVVAASAAAAEPAQRDGRQDPGPEHVSNIEVGERPPSTFTLPTLDGETLSLDQAIGKPMLLLFFRGTW